MVCVYDAFIAIFVDCVFCHSVQEVHLSNKLVNKIKGIQM